MWKRFLNEKPKEDGNYLVYMLGADDGLGSSGFIWIANWNMQGDEPEFQDIHGSDAIA
jgi:hypothetical protein